MAGLPEKARRLISGKNFAFVATLNKDGSPHLTPVWIDVDGDDVIVNTTLRRQKFRNISRDPRISVGVFDLGNPYEYVSINGDVKRRITGKKAEDHIDRLAFKYTGAKKYRRMDPSEKRVILVIHPTRITLN